MAKPMIALSSLLSFLSSPLLNLTNLVENKLRRKQSDISVEVLSQALELTSEDDTTKEEQKILQGIVTFGNTDAKQVMKPRMDIFALNKEQDFSDILPDIISNGYSRIPVYEENIDNITGVLYVKDLLPYLDRKKMDWTALQREAYFVPENKKLDDLLAEFKEMKMHLAIVVDEYGGTSGLVTMEDILEEVFGEIRDEFDEDELHYSKLDDNTFVFEGKTALNDVAKILNEEPDVFDFAHIDFCFRAQTA